MQKFFRFILAAIFMVSTFGFVEQSALASAEKSAIHELSTESHASTEEHTGPHIPSPKGDVIEGWSLGHIQIGNTSIDLHVTNTIFSTWIFMGILFIVIGLLFIAIRTEKFPRLRAFGLDIMHRIYAYAYSLIGDEKITKNFIWLLGGLIIVIFFGNIVGLIFDWFVLISKDEWLSTYLRPIYSDLSTTLVFSFTVILLAQITAFYLKGPVNHLGHYLWNYHGDSTTEKIVGVFVGWLHFAGEFIRVGSLSLRLFLNIFVGAVLIAVAVYIGELIPSFHTGIFRVLALPFWFFELLVAFLQAYIFMTLSSLYIKESLPEPHH